MTTVKRLFRIIFPRPEARILKRWIRVQALIEKQEAHNARVWLVYDQWGLSSPGDLGLYGSCDTPHFEISGFNPKVGCAVFVVICSCTSRLFLLPFSVESERIWFFLLHVLLFSFPICQRSFMSIRCARPAFCVHVVQLHWFQTGTVQREKNCLQECLPETWKSANESTLLLLLFAGTIFCEFLRFGKNRKIKYSQKFLPTYQAPWYNHYLRDDFPFWIRHNLSLLIIFAFPFFLPVPSRARKSDVWWYRWWCEFLEWNLNFILRSTG